MNDAKQETTLVRYCGTDIHSLSARGRGWMGMDGAVTATGHSHICTPTPFSAAMTRLLLLQLQKKLHVARL